ncbi:beta-N-acetylhexosaminidase [Sediminibacillus halophilus]|uniref:beta-N-acetylhexosaminidase n=1 Tax=Sediminibacillus halophilus TaxID=482461 RepID=A0A1G9NCK8_9BACI|nr:beta-N-acetylhexosaminidase [Sediminibacillus halophilus]SDL84051.1 beta-N-acetylhexosaminidase [Sediminibacillus halophilus]
MKNKNYKGVFLVVFLLVLAVAAVFYLQKHTVVDSARNHVSFLPPRSPVKEIPGINQNPEEQIEEILKDAREGKIRDASFIDGETDRQMVIDQWGDPDQKTETDLGVYEDYHEKKVTIGYVGDFVFDLRSFSNTVQALHFKDIIAVLGDPDNTTYYEDEKHNQEILHYQVNDSFELRWILPKPDKELANPTVDHISLITDPDGIKVEDSSASTLVKQMNLSEKIGQMVIGGISGTGMGKQEQSLIDDYHIGGFIFYAANLESPKQTNKLLNNLKAENKQNKLPLLLSVDQEGGRISRLPGNLSKLPTNEWIGELDKPDFSYQAGEILGNELKAFGFNMNFAPVLDVNSNPDNPVIGDRSFGADPEIVSELGVQTMKGIESKQIIPVIKHFPGHGDTSVDSHYQLPKVNKTLEQLEKLELLPFRRAINQGADAVMIAHILLPHLDESYPASISKEVITDLLRNRLGYDGLVMTDDMTMEAIIDNFEIGQASVDSVLAGSDVILVAHDYQKVVRVIDALRTAVENGEISEERINESVKRIIRLKQQYGLKDDPVNKVDITSLNQSIDTLLNKYNQ